MSHNNTTKNTPKKLPRVAHTLSFMYAPHEHAPHLCQRVLSMACPGFLTVPQGGMSAPPAISLRLIFPKTRVSRGSEDATDNLRELLFGIAPAAIGVGGSNEGT